MPTRGRHKSSCKDGRKTIAYLESLKSVQAVIIGMSIGGKSIGKGNSPGFLKIQREEQSGFKAVLQTSKGVQEVFIKVETKDKVKFKKEIKEKFSS